MTSLRQLIFYDDRGKQHEQLVSTKILYEDNDLCICEALLIDINNEILKEKEKIVFNVHTHEVYNPEYQFWCAELN